MFESFLAASGWLHVLGILLIMPILVWMVNTYSNFNYRLLAVQMFLVVIIIFFYSALRGYAGELVEVRSLSPVIGSCEGVRYPFWRYVRLFYINSDLGWRVYDLPESIANKFASENADFLASFPDFPDDKFNTYTERWKKISRQQMIIPSDEIMPFAKSGRYWFVEGFLNEVAAAASDPNNYNALMHMNRGGVMIKRYFIADIKNKKIYISSSFCNS